ncbi:hypothetical protein ES703_11332 [subsurface metagenome]
MIKYLDEILSLISTSQWLSTATHHLLSIGTYETEAYHREQALISLGVVKSRIDLAIQKITDK